MTRFRLGWRLPGLGVARALGEISLNDPTWDLMLHVWGDNHDLAEYAVWSALATGILRIDDEAGTIVADYPHIHRMIEAVTSRHPQKHIEQALISDLWGGGWDNLHLTLHLDYYWEHTPPSEPAQMIAVDTNSHSATLVCQTGLGWYAALTELGQTLPNLGEHSWHVDVFVKPIGFMGTYRQSRETSLWFTGKHSLHMLGN